MLCTSESWEQFFFVVEEVFRLLDPDTSMS